MSKKENELEKDLKILANENLGLMNRIVLLEKTIDEFRDRIKKLNADVTALSIEVKLARESERNVKTKLKESMKNIDELLQTNDSLVNVNILLSNKIIEMEKKNDEKDR